MATPEVSDRGDTATLFEQIEAYPWSEDHEFQGGLSAILGSVTDPEQTEHLTMRAKCYYFSRKSQQQVDFNSYKQWVLDRRSQTSPNGEVSVDTEGTGGGLAEAPKPASFAEICELIAEGKPIPGIKDIPDTILSGQASERQVDKRKKPWEKDSAASENPSWMT